MNRNSPVFLAAALAAVGAAALSLAACSSADLYQVGQSWQQQECRKLADPAERGRCEKSRVVSYDKYRAEADANQPRVP